MLCVLGRVQTKLFYLMLKKLLVISGEPLGFFISSCFHFSWFHFFLFLFLFIFIPSCFRIFRCFYCWLHLFTSLFLYCLCFYRECYGFERALFTLRHFLSYTPFLLWWRLHWGRKFCLEGCRASHWGLKHRPSPSVCLNNTVFCNYMISMELYLNLPKYVDKLLVVKSLISFKHIVIW